MINAKTQKEIDRLSDDLISNFAPPEFVPGCKVTAITDKDEYATDNGWIVAICGRHNNQRCRWTGQLSSITINDYVDVLYYPSYKLFVVFGQGGTSAAQSGKYLLTDGTRAGSTSQAQSFGATGIKADVVAESTGAAGVTVDGVVNKDSEIYPQGDLRGIATRLINPLSFTLDDDHHFRADAIPTGYTWINPATGAGVTPAVLDYSLFNEYLYVSETTSGQRDFLQKTAAAYNGSQIYARLSCGFQGEIGLRVDDSANPTTNFCEIYVTGAPTGGLIQLAWRYNSSTPTTAFTIPAGQELNIRLYLLSGTQFFGYTFGSAGIAVNVFNSPSGLTWPGTAFELGNLRAGLFYKHTGTLGNPATVDWFYSTFE